MTPLITSLIIQAKTGNQSAAKPDDDHALEWTTMGANGKALKKPHLQTTAHPIFHQTKATTDSRSFLLLHHLTVLQHLITAMTLQVPPSFDTMTALLGSLWLYGVLSTTVNSNQQPASPLDTHSNKHATLSLQYCPGLLLSQLGHHHCAEVRCYKSLKVWTEEQPQTHERMVPASCAWCCASKGLAPHVSRVIMEVPLAGWSRYTNQLNLSKQGQPGGHKLRREQH
jgi:hypothetical protein